MVLLKYCWLQAAYTRMHKINIVTLCIIKMSYLCFAQIYFDFKLRYVEIT